MLDVAVEPGEKIRAIFHHMGRHFRRVNVVADNHSESHDSPGRVPVDIRHNY